MRIAMITLLAAFASSCGDAGPVELTAREIAGEYELVLVYGKPLPAESDARTTIYRGHFSLAENQRFTRTGKAETCLLGACSLDSSSTSGVWVVLQDGRLYFNDGRGYSWPVPRIEASRSEIRFYAGSLDIPSELYRKQTP